MTVRPTERQATLRFGFTLLEVILALAMVSLVALSLYASLQTACKARERASLSIEPARAASVSMELFRQDVESALSPNGILAGPFIGRRAGQNGVASDTLEFYAPGHDLDRMGLPGSMGIRKVELGLEMPADGGLPRLVRRLYRNLLAPQTVLPEEEILCRGVKEFRLRYFDGSLWQDVWDSTTQGDVLPVAVQALLRLECPSQKPGLESSYSISRLFTLACHRDATTTQTQGGK